MSLVLWMELLDTQVMIQNDKKNTTGRGSSPALWREAMGPGYQAATLSRSVERLMSHEAMPPATPNSVAGVASRSRQTVMHRVRNWLRYRRGYTSIPEPTAPGRIGHTTLGPRCCLSG